MCCVAVCFLMLGLMCMMGMVKICDDFGLCSTLLNEGSMADISHQQSIISFIPTGKNV